MPECACRDLCERDRWPNGVDGVDGDGQSRLANVIR